MVRSAGIKLILRFSYNFPSGGDDDDDDDDYEKAQDATLERVLEHISQLRPVLQRNADVVAVLQAGFIGAWGEWHSSSNDLTSPENKRAILNALLNATGPTRTVQVRYPPCLMRVYPSPLTAVAAHSPGRSDDHQGRTGHHKDCFLVSKTDAGTYAERRPKRNAQKRYVEQASKYVMVGGETCAVKPLGRQRSDCETALAEMGRFHYTYMNHLSLY